MTALAFAFLLDIFTVFACISILVRRGRLSASHPATTYIFYHLIVFTWRAANILVFNRPTYTIWTGKEYVPISVSLVAKALALADLGFFSLTIGWLRAAKYESAGVTNRVNPEHTSRFEFPSLDTLWLLFYFVFFLGIIGMVFLTPSTDQSNSTLQGANSWTSSLWVTNIKSWAGLATIILVFFYGFKKTLTIMLIIFALYVIYQVPERVRFLLPLILVGFIYLDRKGKKWPDIRIWPLIVGAVIVFSVIDAVGPQLRQGGSWSQISSDSSQILTDSLKGNRGEWQALDSFGIIVKLVDEKQSYQFFKHYPAFLLAPIPHQLWPDKPKQNAELTELSTPETRSIVASGIVTTFFGDIYINLGFIGIILISYAAAYWLARWHFYAYQKPYLSLARFVWLWAAANLIPLYHSSFTGFFMTMTMYMMPLFLFALTQYFVRSTPYSNRRWQDLFGGNIVAPFHSQDISQESR